MVTGRPVGGKQAFRKNEEITIEIPKKALFIQTDKPIYKPGQTGTQQSDLFFVHTCWFKCFKDKIPYC